MSERIAAIDAIDEELNYQDKKWGDVYDDGDWSIGDWIIFMERYVERAKALLGHPIPALCEVRKIGALAVKCMICHGTVTRTEEDEADALSEER